MVSGSGEGAGQDLQQLSVANSLITTSTAGKMKGNSNLGWGGDVVGGDVGISMATGAESIAGDSLAHSFGGGSNEGGGSKENTPRRQQSILEQRQQHRHYPRHYTGNNDVLLTNQRAMTPVRLAESGMVASLDLRQLAVLGPQSLIGDIPTLLGIPQPASVVAATPCKYLSIPASLFEKELQQRPELKRAMKSLAEQRMGWIADRCVDQSQAWGDEDEKFLLPQKQPESVLESGDDRLLLDRSQTGILGGSGMSRSTRNISDNNLALDGLAEQSAFLGWTEVPETHMQLNYSDYELRPPPEGIELYDEHGSPPLSTHAEPDTMHYRSYTPSQTYRSPTKRAGKTQGFESQPSPEGNNNDVSRSRHPYTEDSDFQGRGLDQEERFKVDFMRHMLVRTYEGLNPTMKEMFIPRPWLGKLPGGHRPAHTAAHGIPGSGASVASADVDSDKGSRRATRATTAMPSMKRGGLQFSKSSSTLEMSKEVRSVPSGYRGTVDISNPQVGKITHHRSGGRYTGWQELDSVEVPVMKPLKLTTGGALRISIGDYEAATAVDPLLPFPTITKNRKLHTKKLPLVRHSNGYLDPYRAQSVQARFDVASARASDPGRALRGADRSEIDSAIQRSVSALQRRGTSHAAL